MISQKKANPIYNALAVFLLLSSAVLFISGPMIPKAHASTPTVVQITNSAVLATNTNVKAFPVNVVANNVLLAAIGTLGSLSLCTALSPVSVTDSQGNAYTLIASQPCIRNNGADFYSSIWAAVAKNSAADTITYAAQAGSAGQTNYINMAIYEVSGISPNVVQATGNVNTSAIGTGGCSGTCNYAISLGSSIGYSSNDFLIAQMEAEERSSAASWTAGASFTLSSGGDACSGSASSGGCSEYQIVASDGTSSFPATWGIVVGNPGKLGFVESAAILGPAQATVFSVVPCTFYQLQCWWYPLFFFGVGLAPFMLVGGLGRVNAKGMTYLLLAGLTLTSMIEVLMGLINVMFPLALVGLTIFYAVRSG